MDSIETGIKDLNRFIFDVEHPEGMDNSPTSSSSIVCDKSSFNLLLKARIKKYEVTEHLKDKMENLYEDNWQREIQDPYLLTTDRIDLRREISFLSISTYSTSKPVNTSLVYSFDLKDRVVVECSATEDIVAPGNSSKSYCFNCQQKGYSDHHCPNSITKHRHFSSPDTAEAWWVSPPKEKVPTTKDIHEISPIEKILPTIITKELPPPPLTVDTPSTKESPPLTKSIHEDDNGCMLTKYNDKVMEDNDKVTREDPSINSSEFIHEDHDNSLEMESDNKIQAIKSNKELFMFGEIDEFYRQQDEAKRQRNKQCKETFDFVGFDLDTLAMQKESKIEEQLQDISFILVGNNCLVNPLEYWDKDMPVAEITLTGPQNGPNNHGKINRAAYKHVDDLILDYYDSSGILFSNKSLMALHRRDPHYETLVEELDDDDNMDDVVSQCFKENLLLPNPTLLQWKHNQILQKKGIPLDVNHYAAKVGKGKAPLHQGLMKLLADFELNKKSVIAGPSKVGFIKVNWVPISKAQLLLVPTSSSPLLVSGDTVTDSEGDSKSPDTNPKEKNNRKRKPPAQVLSANIMKYSRRSSKLQRKSVGKIKGVDDAESLEEY
eukprot:Gb_34038 [translate_table: standard]